MLSTSLKELTLSITDGKHGDCESQSNSGYYFISCKDVKDGTIHYENAREITEKDFFEANKRTMLEPNDILLTNSGTIGRMAYVKDLPETYCTTFQKSVAIIKPDAKKVYPQYLYYQLQACVDDFINQSNGSAQKNLLLSTMRSFKMSIHEDEHTQRYIAGILSNYDNLIENNQKQIKLLEEAAQRLYKEWFVDLRFPGYEHTPVVDGVPEGWKKKTAYELSSVLRRGISPKYNDEAQSIVINQKCIRQTVVSFDEARKQEKQYPVELGLQDGDTVICSTGAGTLGRVGQVFGEHPNTTLDSHVTLVRANELGGKQYLFWSLKQYQSYLMEAGKGSTNQLELSRDTIGLCKMLLPADSVLKRYEELAEGIHKKIGICVRQNELLREKRDQLLPKLMSGEIEV